MWFSRILRISYLRRVRDVRKLSICSAPRCPENLNRSIFLKHNQSRRKFSTNKNTHTSRCRKIASRILLQSKCLRRSLLIISISVNVDRSKAEMSECSSMSRFSYLHLSVVGNQPRQQSSVKPKTYVGATCRYTAGAVTGKPVIRDTVRYKQ